MASLTEAARQVLMKEGMVPSVSSSQSDPDAGAKMMTPNSATLRPGSRGIEPRFANPNAPEEGEFEEYEDLGGPVTSATDPNPYAKVKTKKDNSKSAQSAVPAEDQKTQGQGVMAEAIAKINPDKPGKINPIRAAFNQRKNKEKTLDQFRRMTDVEAAKKEKMDEEFEMTEKRQMSRIADFIRSNHPNIEDYSDNKVMRAVHNETKDPVMRKKLVDHFAGQMDEEFEISEELESFIESMIEEGHSDEEIAEAIDENFELVSEEQHEDENDEKEEKSKKMKKMMKEHVDALLAGENLSEDFREKAETIFESAVSTRVQEEVTVLEEAYAKSLEEEVTQIHEQLIEQVDAYLNYVVEQWVSENEVAIESGLRTELTEGFISGLHNLFSEHYINVPEEEVNIVEEMGNKLEKIETRLNEEIDRNVSLSQMLNESKQTEILFSAYDGLTTTQAAKLRSLAENVTFTTPEEYEAKVQTLKESYFSKSVTQRTTLDPFEDADGRTMIAEEHKGPMAHYVKAIGKTIK
jgi:hypothetical protein